MHAHFLKSDPNSGMNLSKLFNFLEHDFFRCLFSVGWIVVFQLQQAVILTKVLKNPESSSICRIVFLVIKRPVAMSESIVPTFIVL